MKRLIPIIAVLLCASAWGEPSECLQGEALQAEIVRVCDAGCIVLSPAEVQELQLAIVQRMAGELQRAYEMGKKASDETCRNKING